MSSPKKYDPPETVVGPALSELMDRVARSRVYVRGEVEMSEEERKIFDYGVSERKRVLEHTLFLVFGQWAFYRQAISRLKWRGARVAYGVTAFASTTYFIGARARRVSHEMFATIATTATSSALGNEARVVLAELEGPDGPYFRQVCRDRGFAEDLTSVMAAKDAEENVDPAGDHLHAQLRLRPRLPARVGVAMQHPAIEKKGVPGERRDPRREVDFRPARVQRARDWARVNEENGWDGVVDRGRMMSGKMKKEGGDGIGGGSGFDFRKSASGTDSLRKERRKDEADADGEDLWGTPFDFKKAASHTGDDAEWGNVNQDNMPDEAFVDEKANEEVLTPSQRRAEERRQRRMRARARSGAGGEGSMTG